MLPVRVCVSPELFDTRFRVWKMIHNPLCEAVPCRGLIRVQSKEFSRVDLANHVLKFIVRTMEQGG